MILGYDADWLITQLAKEKRTRPLSKRFERIRALDSIQADLEQVQQAISQIEEAQQGRLGSGVLTEAQGAIDRGLATFAIVVYSRSTDTSSDTRPSFDPRRFYTKNQIGWHDGIVDLRNKAVAHFGSGRHPSGTWSNDKLVMLIDPEKGSIRFGYNRRRVNYYGRVILELKILIPLALAGLQQDRNLLIQNSHVEINKFGAELARLLSTCPAIPFRPSEQQQYEQDFTLFAEDDVQGPRPIKPPSE